MKKKNLYFNIYLENELENDIELIGSADNVVALANYFEKKKDFLYSLGVRKVKNLRIKIEVNNVKYEIIVDSED